jgi:membrane-bound ClpP family serine protease
MIPTLILFGVAFGRWWRLCLITAALGWPVLLVVSDVMTIEVGLLGAAGLAAINTGMGVLVHQGSLRAVRLLRRPSLGPV